ncbi:MAG: phosphomannomutase/phosphoglucomutase [Bacteroidales bacterium]|nr:phosphomannomutase/phosphoglucomutase [Bacteroidales bacterium]
MLWRDLQNGSDIRGVALPGITGEPVNLTRDVSCRLGKSLVVWYIRHFTRRPERPLIAVGSDSRLSGPALKSSFCQGLVESGANVLDFGLATTPSMFMSIVDESTRCDAAVMITASHLPFNRNGFKFFSSLGGFEEKDITELLSIAETGDFSERHTRGTLQTVNYLNRYAESIVTMIRKRANHPDRFNTPLKGHRIIVDAGNGAGGFFATQVLQVLGADITGSQFLEPDGSFPNHVPNPEDEKAMQSIQLAVLKAGADLGIIFDTDVDRAAIVIKDGSGINRNRLIALLSAIVLEEHPGSTVVTDSVTSEGLSRFIEEHNGIHLRFKRGYKNVINEAVRLNKTGKPCWLAIETSGHAAMKENYFLDDGAYVIAKILIKVSQFHRQGKALDELIKTLAEPVESREFRIKISDDDFSSYGTSVIAGLESFIEHTPGWKKAADNYEGIRVVCSPSAGNGWFLLRLSLHDPVLPLNVESDDPAGVPLIVNKLVQYLTPFDKLDVSSIHQYILTL